MSSVAVRVTLGLALAMAGVLGLIDLLADGADLQLWWIGVQLGASAVFWVAFATDRGAWWAAIPAAVLAAIGVRSLLELAPGMLTDWREFVFFAIASLGFWAVAATKKRRWWAIIPAGMLVSLGAADVTERLVDDQAAGVALFVGASLTFVVLALAPGGRAQRWAWFPAIGLAIVAAIIALSLDGIEIGVAVIWPILVVVGGIAIVVSALRSRR